MVESWWEAGENRPFSKLISYEGRRQMYHGKVMVQSGHMLGSSVSIFYVCVRERKKKCKRKSWCGSMAPSPAAVPIQVRSII